MQVVTDTILVGWWVRWELCLWAMYLIRILLVLLHLPGGMPVVLPEVQ